MDNRFKFVIELKNQITGSANRYDIKELTVGKHSHDQRGEISMNIPNKIQSIGIMSNKKPGYDGVSNEQPKAPFYSFNLKHHKSRRTK
jgi:hypothetical protein